MASSENLDLDELFNLLVEDNETSGGPAPTETFDFDVNHSFLTILAPDQTTPFDMIFNDAFQEVDQAEPLPGFITDVDDLFDAQSYYTNDTQYHGAPDIDIWDSEYLNNNITLEAANDNQNQILLPQPTAPQLNLDPMAPTESINSAMGNLQEFDMAPNDNTQSIHVSPPCQLPGSIAPRKNHLLRPKPTGQPPLWDGHPAQYSGAVNTPVSQQNRNVKSFNGGLSAPFMAPVGLSTRKKRVSRETVGTKMYGPTVRPKRTKAIPVAMEQSCFLFRLPANPHEINVSPKRNRKPCLHCTMHKKQVRLSPLYY
jgi:hypothetical protein